MNKKDELLELLEINSEMDWGEDDQLAEFESQDAKEDLEPEKSETYLKTTNWDEEQGKRVLNTMDNGESSTVMSLIGFMVQNPNYHPGAGLHSDLTHHEYGRPTQADFYASVYNRNPQVIGPCKNEHRQKFMEDMMQLPDY